MQTSYLCSIVRNLLATKESDLVDLDHFVPKFDGQQQERKQFDAAAHEKQMAAMFGNK